MKRIIAALICLGALASCDTEWKQARQIEKNIIEPSFRSVNYLITDFGAFQGDTSSTTLKAINTAIDVCTTEGGGHVIIPEGKWFCKGSVILKSNVDLHFQDGGELVFSTDEKDFLPCVLTRWEGTDVYNYSPMIYAYQQHDIAITGKGILNGQGKQNFEKWKKVQKPDQRALREMGRSGVPVQERVFGEGHWLRPAMTDIIGCSRVKLEDLTIVDGTFWSYHMIACDGCIFRNLRVDSENLNSDGCDPESCSNVLIEGCWFHTGDDGIAVKSGRDQDGWRQGRACENIIIRNCIFDTFANGICIGSEISGGVRNVFIENCIINNAQQGIYFKSNPDRGGYMENVHVRKIKVEHVGGELIKFEPNYKSEKSQNYPTPFKNFRIQSVNARKVDGIAIDIVGFNDLPIKDVLIYNVNVDSAATESRIRNVQHLNIFNCTVNGHSQDTTIMEGTALPPPFAIGYSPTT